LTLVKEANERCGGHFNDSISQDQQTTYWWFLVIDENGIRTFYYEPGKYNYLARDFSCGVIPQ
jgi:sugar/nucleoside kinase (ribokinase family)